MKSILFWIVGVTAISIDQSQLSSSQLQLLDQVKETSWGQVVMTLADISSASDGILQDLIETISGLMVELDDNQAKLQSDYETSQNNYNKKKHQLELQADDCHTDIGEAFDQIDNIITPNKDQLTKKLAQLGEFMNDNRQNLQRESLQRQNEHNSFIERVNEHSDAINAVDECIGLLESMVSTGSLAEIQQTRYTTSVRLIESRVSNKEMLAPLIKVIMEMTSEETFKDVKLARELIDQFNTLRNSLVDSLNKDTAGEQETSKQFEDRVASLENEYAEFQRSATDSTYELSALATELENKKVYLDQRKQDLEVAEEQSRENEDWFAQETNIYTNLKSAYQKELDAASQAHILVSSPDFVNYIKNKGGI